jgi:fibronectin type 3 domain-containing protein
MNSAGSAVSGTGASNVRLAWAASTTPGVTYDVYRCSISAPACVSNQPGNFSQIAKGVTGLSYTDSTVSSGQTYYYAVTAVDTSNTESGLSAVSMAAAIP